MNFTKVRNEESFPRDPYPSWTGADGAARGGGLLGVGFNKKQKKKSQQKDRRWECLIAKPFGFLQSGNLEKGNLQIP